MHINSLSLVDFKGVTSKVTVDKLHAFIGENGCGKTAHLMAPGFAIYGKTPLGGTNDDNAMLAGPLGCSVSVALDDGFQWTRQLKRDPRDHRVTQEVRIVGKDGGSVKNANADILAHVGDFSTMFDLAEFTTLAPDKRRKYVLDLCSSVQGAEAIDDLAVATRIMEAVLMDRLGAATVRSFFEAKFSREYENVTNEERRELIAALLPKLDATFRERLGPSLEVVRAELRGDVAGGIAAAIDTADAMKNTSKRDRDASQLAAQQLSERKIALKVPAASAEQIKEERAKADSDRQEIEAQINLQAGKETARATLTAELERLKAELAAEQERLSLHLQNASTDNPAPSVLEMQALEIESDAGPANEGAKALRDDLAAAQSQLSRLTSDASELGLGLVKEKVKVDQLSSQIADIEKSPRAQLVERARTFEVRHVTKGSMDDWLGVLELILSLCDASGLATLRNHLQQALMSAGQYQEAYDAARSALEAAENEVKAKQAVVDSHQAQADKWNADRDAKLRKASDLRIKAGELRHYATAIACGTQRLQASIKILTDQIVKAEGRLNELDAQGGHVNVEELKAQSLRLATRMAQLDVDLDAKTRFHALDRELQQTILNAEQQGVSFEVYESIGRALRSLREELMFGLVKPLMSRINEFLHAAGCIEEAYCQLVNDRGKPIFAIGWQDGMQAVVLEALSGGEACLFGAALMYALVVVKNPPLKLLMLELAEADDGTAEAIMTAADSLSANLSNVFVATCHEPVSTIQGFAITNLSRVEAA